MQKSTLYINTKKTAPRRLRRRGVAQCAHSAHCATLLKAPQAPGGRGRVTCWWDFIISWASRARPGLRALPTAVRPSLRGLRAAWTRRRGAAFLQPQPPLNHISRVRAPHRARAIFSVAKRRKKLLAERSGANQSKAIAFTIFFYFLKT